MTDSILQGLSKTPSKTDFFIWCDYIELYCLSHMDKAVSVDNLLETRQEMADTQQDALVIEREDYADGEDAGDEPLAKAEDRQSRAMADRFRYLAFRQRVFGEDLYPFVVEGRYIYLKEDLSEWHFLYLQLLISSSLSYCPKKRWSQITESFEDISYNVFRSIMPDGWEVYKFGKQQVTRYQGHIYDKLLKLAEDVRGRLDVERDDFHVSDSGDSGLDLVAWHPMEDQRPAIPIAFAQCGCSTRDFEFKMLEASPSKLGAHLKVVHEWANYYFMPQAMCKQGNGWERYSDFGRSIVVDRVRVMKLLRRYNVDIDDVLETELVEEARSLAYS
mgnify:CR=1 FL=1